MNCDIWSAVGSILFWESGTQSVERSLGAPLPNLLWLKKQNQPEYLNWTDCVQNWFIPKNINIEHQHSKLWDSYLNEKFVTLLSTKRQSPPLSISICCQLLISCHGKAGPKPLQFYQHIFIFSLSWYHFIFQAVAQLDISYGVDYEPFKVRDECFVFNNCFQMGWPFWDFFAFSVV